LQQTRQGIPSLRGDCFALLVIPEEARHGEHPRRPIAFSEPAAPMDQNGTIFSRE
jgi:hypothetical protein